jgi:hypothetical protein
MKRIVESHVCALELPVVSSRPRLKSYVDWEVRYPLREQLRVPRIIFRGILNIRTVAKSVHWATPSLEVVLRRVDRELPTAKSEIDMAVRSRLREVPGLNVEVD